MRECTACSDVKNHYLGGEVAQSSDGALCSTPFKEAVLPRTDRSIHGVPPSVNGLVHLWSVPILRE